MLDYIIVIIPVIAAAVAFYTKNSELRRKLIPITASAHFILSVCIMSSPRSSNAEEWVSYGSTGRLFLIISSILFLMTSFYCYNYLKAYHHSISAKNIITDNSKSESIFVACLLIFFSTISLVIGAHNIGLLWIAMEATTLASAPLIYFNRTRYSLEATWKYLLICSVGIGLALLGNIFMEMSYFSTGHTPSLFIKNLLLNANILDHIWLKTAFVFFIVGYGTKMGLVPMHTWLPDAHSEAPAMISALMSGTLLNCGFLGIFRIHQILCAAGIGDFSRNLLIVFGLLSLLFASIFIFRQKDIKRMLAYSSIENMGIIAFAFGIGGSAVYGGLLQMINHSLTKGALFMIAGNIYLHYKTRNIQSISGVIETLPVSGIFWLAGFVAISGIPPFGFFISEFIIIKSALSAGDYVPIIIFIFLLTAVFAGMSLIFVKTAFGKKPDKVESVKSTGPFTPGEKALSIYPPAILISMVLILGIYIPPYLSSLINVVGSLTK